MCCIFCFVLVNHCSGIVIREASQIDQKDIKPSSPEFPVFEYSIGYKRALLESPVHGLNGYSIIPHLQFFSKQAGFWSKAKTFYRFFNSSSINIEFCWSMCLFQVP